MRLNLPILDQLKDSKNILIAGAGGGFDVFCGLPIYFTLQAMGKAVHLANYSFSPIDIAEHYCPTEVLKSGLLVGANGEVGMPLPYYPEGFLAQWFTQVRDEDVTIWMFAKTGPKTLIPLYQQLVDHLNIDALVLVDGGVDSLMRGDETGAGTFLEDSITLAAVEPLDVPVKILTCVGFGAELEVCHYNALDNMARLVKEGAFLGNCALTPQMDVYRQYEHACHYVWTQQGHAKSHINMRMVSAVGGHFGDHHLYHDYKKREVFVSPLMALYWFFDAQTVIDKSDIIPQIRDAVTIEESFQIAMDFRVKLQPTARPFNPLPY